jgi:hypothetical protein
MGLAGFAPRETTFTAELVGGEKVELTLRPFTLADIAWLQENFPGEKALEIAAMKVDAVCRIIWHMLTSESKAVFANVKFTKYNDESEQDEPVEIHGYQKIVHSFASQQTMLAGFEAFARSRDMNGFQDDGDLKKKKRA